MGTKRQWGHGDHYVVARESIHEFFEIICATQLLPLSLLAFLFTVQEYESQWANGAIEFASSAALYLRGCTCLIAASSMSIA